MASPAALSVMDTPFCQAISTDLASPLSLLVKDASKRKRVNRNAKLKQCKLDARREQWLSQVTMIKPGKEGHQEPPTSNKLDLGEIAHPENDDNFTLDLHWYSSENLDRVLSHSHLRIQHPENCGVGEDLKDKSSPSGSGSCVSDCSEFSPKSSCTESPKGKVTRVGKDHQWGRPISDFEGSKTKDCITGNINQSIGNYAVGAHKAEELDYESENEDWEAAADALGLNHSQEVVFFAGPTNSQVEEKNKLDLSHMNSVASSKPTISSLAAPCEVMSRSASGRAWRPDDTHRPASLPTSTNNKAFLHAFWARNNNGFTHQRFCKTHPLDLRFVQSALRSLTLQIRHLNLVYVDFSFVFSVIIGLYLMMGGVLDAVDSTSPCCHLHLSLPLVYVRGACILYRPY